MASWSELLDRGEEGREEVEGRSTRRSRRERRGREVVEHCIMFVITVRWWLVLAFEGLLMF